MGPVPATCEYQNIIVSLPLNTRVWNDVLFEQKRNSNENNNNENIPTVDGGSHPGDNQLDSPDVV